MRKSGLRKMSLVMASVLVMGSLAACQSSGGSETPAAEATAAENSQSEAAPAEGSGEARELSWYVGEPESHVWSQVSYDIAKEIEEGTGGSLKINVYPGATLGTQAEALDMLRTGSLRLKSPGPAFLLLSVIRFRCIPCRMRLTALRRLMTTLHPRDRRNCIMRRF